MAHRGLMLDQLWMTGLVIRPYGGFSTALGWSHRAAAMSLAFWALILPCKPAMAPTPPLMALRMVLGELAPFRMVLTLFAGLVPWHPEQLA